MSSSMRGGVALIYSPFWIASKLAWHSSSSDRSVALWCLCGAYANCFAQCLRSHWGAQQRGASNDDDDDDAEVDAGRAEPMPRCSFNQLRRRRKHNIQYIVLMNMYIYMYVYIYTYVIYICECGLPTTNAHGFLVLRCRHLALLALLLLSFVYLREAVFLVCFDRCFSLMYMYICMYIYVRYKVCSKVRNENTFKIAFKTHLHRTYWMIFWARSVC